MKKKAKKKVKKSLLKKLGAWITKNHATIFPSLLDSVVGTYYGVKAARKLTRT